MSEQIKFESATCKQSLQVAVGDVLNIGMDVPGRVASIEVGAWRFSDKRKVSIACEVIDPENGKRFERLVQLHPDQPEFWPRHWTDVDDEGLIRRSYPHTVTGAELSGITGKLQEEQS